MAGASGKVKERDLGNHGTCLGGQQTAEDRRGEGETKPSSSSTAEAGGSHVRFVARRFPVPSNREGRRGDSASRPLLTLGKELP